MSFGPSLRRSAISSSATTFSACVASFPAASWMRIRGGVGFGVSSMSCLSFGSTNSDGARHLSGLMTPSFILGAAPLRDEDFLAEDDPHRLVEVRDEADDLGDDRRGDLRVGLELGPVPERE